MSPFVVLTVVLILGGDIFNLSTLSSEYNRFLISTCVASMIYVLWLLLVSNVFVNLFYSCSIFWDALIVVTWRCRILYSVSVLSKYVGNQEIAQWLLRFPSNCVLLLMASRNFYSTIPASSTLPLIYYILHINNSQWRAWIYSTLTLVVTVTITKPYI